MQLNIRFDPISLVEVPINLAILEDTFLLMKPDSFCLDLLRTC